MTATKSRQKKAAAPKPLGRPSAYTKSIGTTICNRLADGESLRKICSTENMPSKTSVFRWLESNPEFRNQYARAREIQADALFDECLDIADASSEDTFVDNNGNIRTDNEVVQRARLRIDTRKWMAGKLRPKVYGDKTEPDTDNTSVTDALKQLADKLPD